MAGEGLPRRVLLFTSSPLEGSEGADKRVAELLVSTLTDTEFIWFTRWPARSGPRLPAGRPVPIISRDGMPTARVRLQAAAAGAVLARRADLVHAILTIGPGFPLLSRLRQAEFGSRPVIHTAPGVIDPATVGRARPLGVTVAHSAETARLLARAGFGHVHVIPPAVRPALWPRRPRPHGGPAVLFAGHHDPGGGAREAISAVAWARRSGIAVRLVMAMRQRPGQDGRALAAGLAAFARQEGAGDVEVHGHVAGLGALLAAADVLLFTPRALSGKSDIPLTVLEALATGRPVILSDLPEFAELGDGVLQVPAGDDRQAGQVLAALLTEPRRWDAAADRGYQLVRDRFGPERFAAGYRARYQDLLRRAGGRR